MSTEELIAQERRNVELVKKWIKAWETDAGRMVDEIYADSAEVFGPMQNIYFLKRGKSKENWRAVEVANQNLYLERKTRFGTIVAKGDTVVVEVATTETNLKGRVREGWFAAFLTFDKNGKIITDHTYMMDMERTPDPAKAHDPKIKKAMEEMKEAHSRVLAEQ
jgi:ketosteroid isomerase-like protein